MACEADKGITIDQGHLQWVDFYLGCHLFLKSRRWNKVDII
jgi:hypothetical protein